jgi:hypothetical protein
MDTSCLVRATVSLPPDLTPAILMQPHGNEGDEKLKKRKRRDEASGILGIEIDKGQGKRHARRRSSNMPLF